MSNVRLARIGFALLAWVFVALTVVQVYLAGAAIVQLHGNGEFGTHQAVGWVIGIIALVQLALSFAGRLSGRMIGASALLVGLMVAQILLAHADTSALAALHPVNGFLVAILGIWIAWHGLSFIRAPLPPEPVPATPAVAAAPTAAPAAQAEPIDRLKEDDPEH